MDARTEMDSFHHIFKPYSVCLQLQWSKTGLYTVFGVQLGKDS
jgi:hypothetical protein